MISCGVLGVGIYVLQAGQNVIELVKAGEADGGDPDDGGTSITIANTAAILIIVVSSLTVIVTFFGCCGAIKENACMLGTYFAIILAMFVALIVGAVIGYNRTVDKVEAPMKKSMKAYKCQAGDGGGDATKVVRAWDTVQTDVRTTNN